MPEATFLCIDSSEYSRNISASSTVSRLMGTVDFVNIFARSKLQSNPENRMGFLTMAGDSCLVKESLTDDIDQLSSSLGTLSPNGDLKLIQGIKIARLALASRGAVRCDRKIVVFICSPVSYDEEKFNALGILLRKENIAIDVINIGNSENSVKLEEFVQAVNKESNSKYLNIDREVSVVDFLRTEYLATRSSEPVVTEGDSLDADMELALRMSLEEENMRQQQAKSITNEAPSNIQQIEPTHATEGDSLDAEMELALRMSLEEENIRQQQANTTTNEATPNVQMTEPVNAVVEGDSFDADLELALRMSLEEGSMPQQDETIESYVTPNQQKIEPVKEESTAQDMIVDEEIDEDLALAIKMSLEYDASQDKE